MSSRNHKVRSKNKNANTKNTKMGLNNPQKGSRIQKSENLWTSNFILLLQGQFISLFGDVIYEMALGFWVYAQTHSTALMGLIMGVSTIPKIIASPFAGVIVDRHDRKSILIWMDILRGTVVVLIALTTMNDITSIWMVFAVGMILSTCAAFFTPAVNASIPDIVPKSQLVRANSIFNMVQIAQVLGSVLGGIFLETMGAAVMFLINGFSYLLSATCNLFIKIPKIEHDKEENHFLSDMMQGFLYVKGIKGLRYIFICIGSLNFFSFIAIVLFIPLFKQEGLGTTKYGISMATLIIGFIAGSIITSVFHIHHTKRFRIFFLSYVVSCFCFIILSFIKIFPLMLILIFIGGLFLSIINIFIQSIVQSVVLPNMRGKVFSLIAMITQGLNPLSMALGGLLGEISIRGTIFMSFLLIFITVLPFMFKHDFKSFINSEEIKQ